MQSLDDKKDRGFMGFTHALSGLALFLVLVAFVPEFVKWAGWTSPSIILLVAFVFPGAASIPDLDNSVSTAKNSLGILGTGLSVFFRASSRFIQATFRTRRDDANADPHRGFWHTIPAALILGLLTWLATGITTVVNVPIVGQVTLGWIGALVITHLSIQLSFAGLFSRLIKKVIKNSGMVEIISVAVAIILDFVIFWPIPHNQNFWWLSVAVAAGAIVHIFGDAFTTAGIPVFPIVYKGKLWWRMRFLPIKAGGTVENFVFVPLFALIAIVSLVVIIIHSFHQ